MLNADGSYKQFVETKSHRTLTNISHWTPGQPPPTSTQAGPWFVLHDYVTPSEWANSKPHSTIPRATLLISTEGFNGVVRSAPALASNDDDDQSTVSSPPPSYQSQHYQARRKLSASAYGWLTLLSILFTAIWIGAIVGAAQRGQIVWVVIVVLFPCTAVIYFAMSLFSSSGSGLRNGRWG